MQAGIKYDFVGRFERFGEEVRVPNERIAPQFASCLPAVNRHATGAMAEAAKYLTADLKQAIYRKFQPDFEHFGYSISS